MLNIYNMVDWLDKLCQQCAEVFFYTINNGKANDEWIVGVKHGNTYL